MAKVSPIAAAVVAPRMQQRMDAFMVAYDGRAPTAKGLPPPSGAHAWALMLLWENLGLPISQQDIAQFYVENSLGHYDRQVRHKAAAGWHLVSSSIRAQNMEYRADFPRGCIALISLDTLNPRWTANRKVGMTGMEWDAKVALFEQVRGGCGMCGRKCPAYDRGHLERHLPLTVDNSAPLCTSCNNWLQSVALNAYIEEDTLIVRAALPGTTRHERMRKKAQVKASAG